MQVKVSLLDYAPGQHNTQYTAPELVGAGAGAATKAGD